MPRIKRLEIKGFRAFGSQPQVLKLRGPMAVIWGPNSQGKTSLAEAIEFLLTGKTVRRELLASAKREFADALRNAHLPPTEDVIVIADIEDGEGGIHHVRRRLVRDYTGRDPCQSELTIDGKPASDLTTIGIQLSQPPLEAPVLMPHTLRYVVSAEPQERTEYFKAVLEVSDLEEIRSAISNAKNQLALPTNPAATLYDRCRSNTRFGDTLAELDTAPPLLQAAKRTLSEALGRILADIEPAPDGLDARLAAAKAFLEQQRTQTFPINALAVRGEPSWDPQPDLRVLGDFVRARSAIEAEVSRLVGLFTELLKLPEVASATEAINCPVCETPKALTPHRIATIRQLLEANAEFTTLREGAERLLTDLDGLAERMVSKAERTCPTMFAWRDEERSRNDAAMEQLLGDAVASLVPPWRNAVSDLNTARGTLKTKAEDLRDIVRRTRLDELDDATTAELEAQLRSLSACASQFADALRRYGEAAEPLITALRREVDRRAGTEGWQDLIELTEQLEELLQWLIARRAYNEVLDEVNGAIEQIDKAKAEILDEKFSELGQEILRWWNLLRPDEPTSFQSLERTGTGRRFLDLKARLDAPGPTGTQGVVRDAVSVFSDSQLNCLGLATFLARTVREGAGFVVLDDPVPASDEEHRAFFIDYVLQELVNSTTHVILLTHDERMWKDVQERYLHLDTDAFVVAMEDPRAGASVKNRSDTLDALLAKATPYIENANPDIRKFGAQKLRNAAERFCELVLVKHRHDSGDTSANVSDYDGKTLGDLVPKVQPLLTKDSSHPGKLRIIGQRLNPGAHDHAVPPPADLKQCLGDLRSLRKEYLPRAEDERQSRPYPRSTSRPVERVLPNFPKASR